MSKLRQNTTFNGKSPFSGESYNHRYPKCEHCSAMFHGCRTINLPTKSIPCTYLNTLFFFLGKRYTWENFFLCPKRYAYAKPLSYTCKVAAYVKGITSNPKKPHYLSSQKSPYIYAFSGIFSEQSKLPNTIKHLALFYTPKTMPNNAEQCPPKQPKEA